MSYNFILSLKIENGFCKSLIINDLRWGPRLHKPLRINDLHRFLKEIMGHFSFEICHKCLTINDLREAGPQRNPLKDKGLRRFLQVLALGCQEEFMDFCKKKSSLSGGFALDKSQFALTASTEAIKLRPLSTRLMKFSRLKLTIGF